MRARLALAVSGQACELREVILRDKPAQLLAASSKGTVPVLVLPDGEVLDQSLDIMRWALARQDPERWLVPERGSPVDMDRLIAACDNNFKHHLDGYKYPSRYALADAEQHRQAGAAWLAQLNEQLQNRYFLFGNRASLADMAIAPFIRQFAQTDPAWFDQQAWTLLQQWLSGLLASTLFQQVMRKYPPWQPGSQGSTFP